MNFTLFDNMCIYILYLNFFRNIITRNRLKNFEKINNALKTFKNSL